MSQSYNVNQLSCLTDSQEQQSYSQGLTDCVAMLEFSPDGQLLAANQNFKKLLYPDGVQDTFEFTIEDDECRMENPIFWQEIGKGRTIFLKLHPMHRGTMWVRCILTPCRNDLGKVTKVMAMIFDISNKRQILAEHEGRINAINRSQAVIEFDVNGIILNANDNFLNFFGYTRDFLVGQHHRVLCSAELVKSEEYRQFWQKLGRGEFHSGRFVRQNRDGSDVWI